MRTGDGTREAIEGGMDSLAGQYRGSRRHWTGSKERWGPMRAASMSAGDQGSSERQDLSLQTALGGNTGQRARAETQNRCFRGKKPYKTSAVF